MATLVRDLLQQSPGVVGAVAEAGTTVKAYISRKIFGSNEEDKTEETPFQAVESRKHKRNATKSAEKTLLQEAKKSKQAQ